GIENNLKAPPEFRVEEQGAGNRVGAGLIRDQTVRAGIGRREAVVPLIDERELSVHAIPSRLLLLIFVLAVLLFLIALFLVLPAFLFGRLAVALCRFRTDSLRLVARVSPAAREPTPPCDADSQRQDKPDEPQAGERRAGQPGRHLTLFESAILGGGPI